MQLFTADSASLLDILIQVHKKREQRLNLTACWDVSVVQFSSDWKTFFTVIPIVSPVDKGIEKESILFSLVTTDFNARKILNVRDKSWRIQSKRKIQLKSCLPSTHSKHCFQCESLSASWITSKYEQKFYKYNEISWQDHWVGKCLWYSWEVNVWASESCWIKSTTTSS